MSKIQVVGTLRLIQRTYETSKIFSGFDGTVTPRMRIEEVFESFARG